MKQVRKTRGLGHSDGLKDLQDPEDNPMVLYMFFSIQWHLLRQTYDHQVRFLP